MILNFLNRFKGSGSRRPIRSEEYFSDVVNCLTGRKITVKTVEDILDMADNGYTVDQVSLFNIMLDKEPLLASHIQTRKLALLGCNWNIYNKDGSDNEEVEADLKDKKLDKALAHLVNAIDYGYSGVITEWLDGGKNFKFTDIYPSNIIYDLQGNPALLTADRKEVPFADYLDGQFILQVSKNRVGIPSQQGLLRCLTWIYLYKYYGLQHNARFMEKFGNPFLLGKLSKADFNNKEVYDKTMESLKKTGLNGHALVSEGTELDAVTVNNASFAQAFNIWFNYIDDIFAVAILGQKATSGTSNGMSNGSAQENVRLDILQSDCKNLTNTINEQFLKPYQIFNYGKDIGLKFEISYNPPDDLNKEASTVKILFDAGHKAKKEWVEKKFNIPMDDPVVAVANPNQADGGTKAFSDIADAKYLAKEEYISSLTERTLDNLLSNKEVNARLYRPLAETIRSVFSNVNPDDDNLLEVFSHKVDDLFKKFPALYDNIALDDIEKAVQSACLTAMMKGK